MRRRSRWRTSRDRCKGCDRYLSLDTAPFPPPDFPFFFVIIEQFCRLETSKNVAFSEVCVVAWKRGLELLRCLTTCTLHVVFVMNRG
jgi:hypothetical protein